MHAAATEETVRSRQQVTCLCGEREGRVQHDSGCRAAAAVVLRAWRSARVHAQTRRHRDQKAGEVLAEDDGLLHKRNLRSESKRRPKSPAEQAHSTDSVCKGEQPRDRTTESAPQLHQGGSLPP
eukprot:6210028-Pleurochrysis_carterae.AAC.3